MYARSPSDGDDIGSGTLYFVNSLLNSFYSLSNVASKRPPSRCTLSPLFCNSLRPLSGVFKFNSYQMINTKIAAVVTICRLVYLDPPQKNPNQRLLATSSSSPLSLCSSLLSFDNIFPNPVIALFLYRRKLGSTKFCILFSYKNLRPIFFSTLHLS
ncbi:hypothetical protein ES332_A04G054500v1 [Gossypium tomentosum]|uniref:Uncharacterized protein n=1 Tax=Gossypium tomentosum TaxID=34277 RepID=A0A5D2QV89_GOSTO|nr:hypothetical protein ES332_A04G054500v1 [Gossypium tomentosum]